MKRIVLGLVVAATLLLAASRADARGPYPYYYRPGVRVGIYAGYPGFYRPYYYGPAYYPAPPAYYYPPPVYAPPVYGPPVVAPGVGLSFGIR